IPELERAPAAPGHDRQAVVVGERHDATELVDRSGTDDPARELTVDRCGGAGAVVVLDPLATGDGDEGFADRARRGGHRASRSRRLRVRAAAPGGTPPRRRDATAAACRGS